jgi:hypothetical protein
VTTYVEVSQALVTAGYLSDANVEAAAAVRADALVVADAEDAEAAIAAAYTHARISIERRRYHRPT